MIGKNEGKRGKKERRMKKVTGKKGQIKAMKERRKDKERTKE